MSEKTEKATSLIVYQIDRRSERAILSVFLLCILYLLPARELLPGGGMRQDELIGSRKQTYFTQKYTTGITGRLKWPSEIALLKILLLKIDNVAYLSICSDKCKKYMFYVRG
jgi:hypothetical protein